MKILVTFAVAAEFAPWQRRRNFRRLTGTGSRFEAEFGAARVRAVLTGVGQVHALEAVRRALSERPEICISTGLAGALAGCYRPGDLLAARLVSELGEPVAVASHRELLSMARDYGARQIDRLATSPVLVARPEQKQAYASQADAVDMESYTILAEAARCGVPAVAIRAISDTANFVVPYDFGAALDAQGQIRVSRVVGQMLRHPSGFPALIALARNCRFAARRLADFLDVYVGAVADRLIPIEPDMVAAT
jgi:adenosylhomocysteine nucleosidase